HLPGEAVELVDHGVDRVLQLEDLAADVDGDLLAEVAVRDRGGDLGDVAHLAGEVAGHPVHALGQVLPDATDLAHLRLAAELALGAHLAGDPGHLPGGAVELVDHHVDGLLQLEDLATHRDGDLAAEVAVRDRGGDLRDVAHLVGEVAGHRVHAVGEVLPDAAHAAHRRLAAELALGADLAGDAGHLPGEGVELVEHGVDRVLNLEELAADVDGDLLGVPTRRSSDLDLRDVAHLVGEVAGHHVHAVGEVLPDAADPLDLGLAAELALGADLAGDAGHLAGKAVELR